MKRIKLITYIFALSLIVLSYGCLNSCTQARPNYIENICLIFKQYPEWYWDAQAVQKRWGLPISTLMAIIYQESHFNATAKPPRTKLLWIIPWKRPTSAYGYSQAVDHTWKSYKTANGHTFVSRDAFGDAADFIGWYAYQAHQRAGISRRNAYAIYLAYHEGIGGYMRGTYRSKPWLMDVARNVQRRANVYRSQLLRCQASLPKKSWWKMW